eukprot:UN04775
MWNKMSDYRISWRRTRQHRRQQLPRKFFCCGDTLRAGIFSGGILRTRIFSGWVLRTGCIGGCKGCHGEGFVGLSWWEIMDCGSLVGYFRFVVGKFFSFCGYTHNCVFQFLHMILTLFVSLP